MCGRVASAGWIASLCGCYTHTYVSYIHTPVCWDIHTPVCWAFFGFYVYVYIFLQFLPPPYFFKDMAHENGFNYVPNNMDKLKVF
jgi:hypothetical protein